MRRLVAMVILALALFGCEEETSVKIEMGYDWDSCDQGEGFFYPDPFDTVLQWVSVGVHIVSKDDEVIEEICFILDGGISLSVLPAQLKDKAVISGVDSGQTVRLEIYVVEDSTLGIDESCPPLESVNEDDPSKILVYARSDFKLLEGNVVFSLDLTCPTGAPL